jgi:hypothetical protein
MNVEGVFVTNIDPKSRADVEHVHTLLRAKLTDVQINHALSHFKNVLKIYSRDPDKCWGYTSVKASELESGHLHVLLRMGDRIGFHEAFDGWRDHMNMTMMQQFMMSLRVGLMMLIDTEQLCRENGSPMYTLLVFTHKTKESKHARLCRERQIQLQKDMSDMFGCLEKTASEFGMPYSGLPWWDSFYKQKYMYPNLRIAAGSLGVGFGDHVYWEHGDKDWTRLNQFVCPRQGVDAYFWLEDKDGKIFDVLRPNLLSSVLATGYRLDNETFPRIIDGKSIEEMKEQGIVYVPASRFVQDLLIQKVKHINKDFLSQIGWT